MSVDSLRAQISSSRQRLAQLQKRAETSAGESPAILSEAIAQLEQSLTQLEGARDEIAHQRQALAEAKAQLAQEQRRYWHLFDGAPDACVLTAPDGRVVEANRAAAELLNSTQKFLIGKNLSVFCSSDRSRLLSDAGRLAESGGNADWVLELRPRERAAIRVVASVVATGDARGVALRWVLRRTQDPVPAAAGR